MVEDFQIISNDGLNMKINVGYNVSPYEGVSFELRSKILYEGKDIGIKWMNASEEIVKMKAGTSIIGYPSADLKYIISIWFLKNEELPSEDNAMIYNANGSLHMNLVQPTLISDLAKQRNGRVYSHFQEVSWEKNVKGEIVTAVKIAFDRDWFETRELEPATGKFGDVIACGRI